MQVITSYFYPNLVEVQFDNDPLLTLRNHVVYTRTIKLYKGITNTVKIQFKNRDQKPVNVTGFVIKFSMFDENGAGTVIAKECTIVDAVKGIATVTLSEADLIPCRSEFYNYSVLLMYPDGTELAVYADDNYTVRGQIQLLAGHYPEFKPSIDVGLTSLTIPGEPTTVYTSATIIDAIGRRESSTHSAQYFFNQFYGQIEVQGTLDPTAPTGSTLTWSTIRTDTYFSQTFPDIVSWTGVYTAFRFIITNDSGEVTKVLIRS
jgi:hypothetical protein